MTTLLLRLAGPMQSWGTQSRFSVRDTDLEPSFSGVIGLLAAALGRPRGAPIDDLTELRMGVRVDRPGVRIVDFHTAGGARAAGGDYGVYKASGKTRETVTSRRWYLADAEFLVALEGADGLLNTLQAAVQRPFWPLFLGRRSCPPSLPIHLPDGVRHGPGEAVLREYPWSRRSDDKKAPAQLRLVLTAGPDSGFETRRDVPLTFDQPNRAYATRLVRNDWTDTPEVP